MKIRLGFVSNSSSSSFVVAFPSIPSSVEEVKKMLFGDTTAIDIYDNSIETSKMARIVLEDMREKGVVTENDIIEEIASGYCWFFEHLEINCDWYNKSDIEAYYEYRDKEASKLVRKFIESHRNSHFFIFEYCDNDGPLYSTMEHGEIFSRIPHIRISKH